MNCTKIVKKKLTNQRHRVAGTSTSLSTNYAASIVPFQFWGNLETCTRFLDEELYPLELIKTLLVMFEGAVDEKLDTVVHT